MKVLIIGGGGREHALAWRLAQSPEVERVFATPGNPGIARVAACRPAGDGSPDAYLAVAESVDADLTLVGPEAPLVVGVVDAFRAQGRAIFGPTATAARLEGSKIFAKNFLRQSDIPTAAFATAANAVEARRALDRFSYPIVIKADGLAAGKGVVVAQDRATAEAALASLKPPFVIEEFLAGEEISYIVLSDGRNVVPLEPTQDHKAVFDGDTGPNTGGMGAYCDSRILTAAESGAILDRIIRPTIEATGFTGFLYAGLMMTDAGPKVLEFNVRLGDPETQPIMHRMRSDLAPLLLAAARGALPDTRMEWTPGPSVCVVLASGGYPGAFAAGKPIHGIEDAEALGATVFHAGTRQSSSGLETAGGRVLGVTASGADLAAAIDHAYAAAHLIHFDGMHYRTDIGQKGLKRYNTKLRARSSDG
ncbi:MAG TPA: phosphoribosylamine--glycine ligase [Bryobacteraceae bacterium]|nr:phosphoribosylamine--glycine ligase [Bryobacteraceae bacterium]